MTVKVYRVVWRLRSALHIGCGKVGNVQRTRGYVTGRVLWGALTQRLTRNGTEGPATDSRLYQEMGERVHRSLAFTYLYPTTDPDGTVELWPWEPGFRARFLGSYASTALGYPQRSAEEGSLHEVECVAPNALDDGAPVYLAGYLFAAGDAPDWGPVLGQLQFGGERGYGWGRVAPVAEGPQLVDEAVGLLFGRYRVDAAAWPPVLEAVEETDLLAHALASAPAGGGAVEGMAGRVEPLVGRMTDPASGRSGVRLSEARICYAPGGQVSAGARFRIGRHGIWESAP